MTRTYMKSAEFKARQMWLNFVDAVGIALRAIEGVKANAWAWFKDWNRKPAKKDEENKTLWLPFEITSHAKWQQAATQKFFRFNIAKI